jgi:DNA processing protein
MVALMYHPAPFSSDQREREAALALLSVRGVGPATLASLAREFGSLHAAYEAGAALLEPHLRPDACAELRKDPSLRGRLELTLARLAEHRAKVLFRGEPGWPPALADLDESEPIALFVMGELDPNKRGVAVVGSRRADRYGLERATGLGARLAGAHLVTVSGGAKGVDCAAHTGALEANGATYAVLGSGFDFPYPRDHGPLYERIVAQGGAVVSEFPPVHEPKQGNFPRRNRVVAAIAEVTVVVRGDVDSGAMLTAEEAHRLRRSLLAVPGRVEEEQSRGPHLLLRLGRARPCCDFSDVLRALGMMPPLDERALSRGGDEPAPGQQPLDLTPPEQPAKLEALSAPAAAALKDLHAVPRHFDELAQATRLSVPALAAALTELELAGLAEQRPGKLFLRRRRG